MRNKEDSKIGWNFDNSYAHLPEIMLSKIAPVPVQKPQLIILNHIWYNCPAAIKCAH